MCLNLLLVFILTLLNSFSPSELVIKQFSLPAGDGNNDVQKEELNTALDSIIPQIKELPLTFKATDDPNEDN